MNIEELQILQGSYNKLVAQNKSFQTDLNAVNQELEELTAGLFMLAEIWGLNLSHSETAKDIIELLAQTFEDKIEVPEVQ